MTQSAQISQKQDNIYIYIYIYNTYNPHIKVN